MASLTSDTQLRARSALHYAANAGEDLATMTLLDCKAEVDAVDDKGWSAPEAGESGSGFPTHLRKAVSSTITIPMKQP